METNTRFILIGIGDYIYPEPKEVDSLPPIPGLRFGIKWADRSIEEDTDLLNQ